MSELDDLNTKVMKLTGWTSGQLGQVFVFYDASGRMHGAEPRYTRDIAKAWELVEEVQAEPREQWFNIDRAPGISKRWIACIGGIAKAGDTAPEAICRAYVAWKEAH
jgi:hypothetical protein